MSASSSAAPDLAAAKATPSEVFASPREVLQSAFSADEKVAILESWRDQCEQLEEGEAEGFEGGERSRLREVSLALEEAVEAAAG